jgi:hypothetical protein
VVEVKAKAYAALVDMTVVRLNQQEKGILTIHRLALAELGEEN